MRYTSFLSLLLLAGAFFLAAVALASAQQTGQPKRVDVGKVEYENKCATCHGLKGKGDGPMAGFVDPKIADLTVLAKKNNGILPVAAMYDVIVGEREVRGHGSSDMPVWGREYRIKAAEYYIDVPYDPETYVRTHVLALIEYINRLQAK